VVRYGDREVAARALVDSGADVSLLPLEWSSRLGLATATRTEQLIETAGGASRLVVYDVSVEVVVRGYGAMIPIAATFADEVPFMLLGRADFFRAFRVAFDERAQTLTLDKYDGDAPLAFAA
jgi:hypothetical protein